VTPTVLPPSASCSWSSTLTKPTSSSSHIVHHRLDVKGWLACPPSVEEGRPGTCPRCACASRPTGQPLGLHGHGLRERQLRGPPEAAAAPFVTVIACRRYRCVPCQAIITVVPRGIAPRRHYGHAAIAMALTLWALMHQSTASVRERVCAWPIAGAGARGWPTLRRWARAQRGPESIADTLRVVAARAAQRAVGRAPPRLRGAPLWAQAFAGGSAMP